ncbi:MAG: sigma-54-dependent Fis family transcriptional regulator [Flavobacteriales bacterium]|nr:sigma-54-dependent Fis family transcriptional regulator [Flavobacteriales bacterium]
MSRILIVDDERPIRSTLRDILEYEKIKVDEAENGIQAIKQFKSGEYDAVLCDIKMPGMDGIEVLTEMQNINPDVPVIMISGHGTIETAVESLKKGAYDYISKPPDLNRLLVTVRNALDRKTLVKETRTLKRKVSSKSASPIIGTSGPIMEVKAIIEKVAPTEARVLIIGPNGTGKELVAKQIHDKSNKSKAPFIEVNCAAIPSELIESELFGHEKGAFTSAIKQRLGKFELASGGTLFLDEIGDMSLSAQAKVLRALQENKITRVGGEKQISVSPRIIAATNKDLKKEIAEGRFREDLFHRLSVILINVPSLNDRSSDIELLVPYFLDLVATESGSAQKEIEQKAIDALVKVDWTGNIRQLRNTIERLVIMSEERITLNDVMKFA